MENELNIILFGAPGVGKGTQAKQLSHDLSLPHIDTGGLIRKAIENKSELGIQAQSFVEGGKLVPDNLIIELIRERLIFLKDQGTEGFILDGYPRTIPQADALQEMLSKLNLSLTKVINLKAPMELIIKRLSSRRMCSKKTCGAIYNLESKLPKVEGKCDICNSDLYQRKDDSEEASAERFKEYDAKTAPLEEYYKNLNLLADIDASKNPEDVFSNILSIIKKEVIA